MKLYIGLGANSISIYSDAVNNLLDSLSGLISFVFMLIMIKGVGHGARSVINKTEELLCLGVGLIVAFTGFSFIYSSAERLMYPTPVWYRKTYLYLLIMTCLIKLVLFGAFCLLTKKSRSPLMKIIATDSLLDFFITSVTVMSLLLSSKGTYAADALCGIVIGVIMTISAVKTVIGFVRRLIGYIPYDVRCKLSQALKEVFPGCEINEIALFGGEEKTLIVKGVFQQEPEKEKCKKINNETGYTVHIINEKGDQIK